MYRRISVILITAEGLYPSLSSATNILWTLVAAILPTRVANVSWDEIEMVGVRIYMVWYGIVLRCVEGRERNNQHIYIFIFEGGIDKIDKMDRLPQCSLGG